MRRATLLSGVIKWPMATSTSGDRLVSNNRCAQFDYELGERFEAGLVLIGSEARSLRQHAAHLAMLVILTREAKHGSKA